MDFILDKGSSHMGCKGCSKRQNNKLNTYDWLCDVPDAEGSTDFVEVQFKNTRKGYYLNSAKIPLEKGDIVAVEASPGHDIGTVSLTGKLVLLQMKKNNVRTEAEPKRIYRKAKPTDIEKYEEAKAKEHATMIRSRQIAADLGLNMKIGDVEYQGDGNKAIFYYIADERVDFRQLIKVLAEAFRVRIEMKQIGARQEAGRIGGIGPCGRELCCSSWMTSFVSVATGAARYQDILVKDNAMLVGEVINLYVSFDDNDDHNDLVFGYLDTFCGFLLKRQIGFLLSNKEIKSIQEYDEIFKYLLWNKEYQSDISKHNYEFVISYNGIMKVEGGR
jgi:cell fate regulator YaaT (PSP1 superfamily)